MVVPLMEIGRQRRLLGKDSKFGFKYPTLEVSLRQAGAGVQQAMGREVRAAPRPLTFLTP